MTSTLRDTALAYWDAGLTPLPRIGMDPMPAFLDASGTITPIQWGQWKGKQPERRLVEHWFAQSDPRQVGIILLAGSDAHPRSQLDATFLQVLDLESAAIFEAYQEELLFTGHADLLHRCILERTPSGGAHLGFRCAAISDKPSLALARRERDPADPTGKTLLIELLQHQCCTVAPTQVQCKPEHPAGVAYTLTHGTWAHPYVISPEQRQILLTTARLFNEVPEVVKADRSEVIGDGTRPGDKLNAAATIDWWQDLLTTHGWRDVSRRSLAAQGLYYFQRPGKIGTQASATYGKTGHCLYVFSENAFPFESKTAYSPFGAYALLEHAGDFTAAAKALAQTSEQAGEISNFSDFSRGGPPNSTSLPNGTGTSYGSRLAATVARYKRQLYADPYFGADERRAKGIPIARLIQKETPHE